MSDIIDLCDSPDKAAAASALPSKRKRGEGDLDGSKLLEHLIPADTDELVAAVTAAGRKDGKDLSDLEEFSERLKASLDREKERIKKAEKAAQDLRAKKEQDEAMKAQDEKIKQRQQLVVEKRCFQCKEVSAELLPCASFKSCGGVSGDGLRKVRRKSVGEALSQLRRLHLHSRR